MRIYSFLFSVILASLIFGCSPKHANTQPEKKPEGVLTEAQKKTLEKANQVDDLLKDTNEKHLKAVDEMQQ